MPNRIVIVEDDHLQEEPMELRLLQVFPGARIDFLATEEEFRTELGAFEAAPPDVVVMDVMLRWALPRPGLPTPPQEVADGGYYRAGFRCASLLAANPRLADVPIIMYTILDRSELQRDGLSFARNWSYLRKSGELEPLVRRINEVCSRARASSGVLGNQ